MKTASLSQCRKLIVASRQNESRADINAYCWDMSHIEATNRWEILPVRSTDLPEHVRLHLKETTGTVVVWQQLDRILGYNNPAGEPARKRLIEMCGKLEVHVAMVFHRFLENKVRGKRLAIYIQDDKVTPWDLGRTRRGSCQSNGLDRALAGIPVAGIGVWPVLFRMGLLALRLPSR